MKISWIKLELELFDNKKIKKIRRMPDGDKILLVWIYLLIEAGKCNAGGMIFISEKVPLDIDDIAKDLNFEISVIQLGIKTFLRLDMIIMDEKEFMYISDWENHQNIEGMEKAKLLRKERNRRYYEKKQITSLDNKATSKTLKDSTDKTRKDKTRKENNNEEEIDKIYNSYPSKCSISKRPTGKSKKCKDKIKTLLRSGQDDLIEIINRYVKECEENKTFMKNFSTFLNNLPDYSENEPVDQNYGMCEAEKKFFEKQRGDNAAS